MTRFNISLDEGVKFVLDSLNRMIGGEIFVPKIPSFRIVDLANAINPKIKKKIIGVRPGEKIHEEMITPSDSFNTAEFKNYFIIYPQSNFSDWSLKEYIKNNKEKNFNKVKIGFTYNSKSNKHFLSVLKIKQIIKNLLND